MACLRTRARLGALAVVLSTLGMTACAESDPAPVTGPEQNVTTAQCSETIKKRVLDRALEISDTASIIETKTLYGDELAFADAVLVRVSDETEPTDYIVVRSRLTGDAVDKGTCRITRVFGVADGVLPDDGLIGGKIGAKCEESMRAAVLTKAKQLSETASIQGVKLVYGGDATFGGAAIVRVSDEVEPTDYLAVFTLTGSEQEDAGTCSVRFTELLNEGVLPQIPGL